jgi:hypothetical protein
MWYLILGIIVLGGVTALVGYVRGRKPGAEAATVVIPPDCCGQHEVCERDKLLVAAGQRIEYYDDDELDSYSGTEGDAYSEEAVEAFREVLYTLRPAEVAGWLRSLQLRHINLPDALRDEAFLIVGEQRINA